MLGNLIAKGLGGGGSQLVKGIAGGVLKEGGGNGILGKALGGIGGPEGIMDLVQQIIDTTKNDNAPAREAGNGAAMSSGAAEGTRPHCRGRDKGDRARQLFTRLADKLAQAQSPQEVDRVIGRLSKRLEAKGKSSPELKQLLAQLGQLRKASLSPPAA